MVKIAPFRGVVYNNREIEAYGGLLTSPPYDVLSSELRQEYLSCHPNNFLHLDYGEVLPEDSNPMAWHERAASTLSHWLSEGVLVRRSKPSVALIDTDWVHPLNGRRMTRHGLVCLMRLEESGKFSRVRPHEKTFSYHKVERLDLMEKTGAQLSPVFGFFPDPDSHFLKMIFDLLRTDPDASFQEKSGFNQQITFIQNLKSLKAIVKALDDVTVYIADGHHRYETALKYRRDQLARLEKNDQKPAENSAIDYVLVYLCPMSDPGLCVLPTHRVLSSLDMTDKEIIQAFKPFADIKCRPFDGRNREAVQLALSKKLLEDDKKGLKVFGLFLRDEDKYYFVKIKEKVREEIIKQNPQEADLNGLDVSILTNVIFHKALGLNETDMDDPERIVYYSSIEPAYSAVADRGARAAFIMNPTRLDEIIRVSESGQVMPRKATYFYPKVSSGLVFNLIDPMESIIDFDD
ncbi:MAG: DUF1015 domain-containing protein [Deltaproteobacteria bacterium]|jgi:uncharacterized protein (DUF1015 family)|nr:DUF1015 domain-containing protein [Deltaproteobacteria bacterium]